MSSAGSSMRRVTPDAHTRGHNTSVSSLWCGDKRHAACRITSSFSALRTDAGLIIQMESLCRMEVSSSGLSRECISNGIACGITDNDNNSNK